ncbi:hypothetical protein ACFE04_007813 [Oxalis oulophora]
MVRRQGDVRVYIVWFFFFGCVITGGIFLVLYLILPPREVSIWYPVAGFILVGIPWTFWLMAYIYICCFKSSAPQMNEPNLCNKVSSHNNFTPVAGVLSPKAPTPINTSSAQNDQEKKSPMHSSNSGGGPRHVQFGAVMVMGNDSVGGGAQIDREAMARQAGISVDDDDDDQKNNENQEQDRREKSQCNDEPLRLNV